jgi:O-antigen/teichoic acid export membrane protein
MLTKSRSFILSFFQGHQRTVRAKKNILVSLVVKGVSLAVTFLLVPLALGYLGDKTSYGVWATISSFLTWFVIFEVGLGSGLKNKLAEALAREDLELGRIYVSTCYAIMGIVISIVSILFFVGAYYIDWASFYGSDKATPEEAAKLIAMSHELTVVSYVVFGIFFLRFAIKLITDVLLAHQRSGLSNALGPLGNILCLPIIYLLTLVTKGSLLYLGLTLSLVPVIVLAGTSIYLYSNEYKAIAPSFRYIKFEYAKNLLNVGVRFFIIQISAIVIFQSSYWVITKFFGPAAVTDYDIAFKFFNMIQVVFTIISQPYWPAFTEAWIKEDFSWIRRTVKGLLKVWMAFAAVGIIMYFASDLAFYYWLGAERLKTLNIPHLFRFLLVLSFLIFTFGMVFNMFINGVGKVMLQTWCLVIGVMLFIPSVYFFIDYLGWGIEGVVISIIIANFYSLFVAPVQYYKIINNKAHGIWNK